MRKEKETLWTKVENYCIDVQALPAAKEQEITKIGKLAQRYDFSKILIQLSLITKMTRSSTALQDLNFRRCMECGAGGFEIRNASCLQRQAREDRPTITSPFSSSREDEQPPNGSEEGWKRSLCNQKPS